MPALLPKQKISIYSGIETDMGRTGLIPKIGSSLAEKMP